MCAQTLQLENKLFYFATHYEYNQFTHIRIIQECNFFKWQNYDKQIKMHKHKYFYLSNVNEIRRTRALKQARLQHIFTLVWASSKFFYFHLPQNQDSVCKYLSWTMIQASASSLVNEHGIHKYWSNGYVKGEGNKNMDTEIKMDQLTRAWLQGPVSPSSCRLQPHYGVSLVGGHVKLKVSVKVSVTSSLALHHQSQWTLLVTVQAQHSRHLDGFDLDQGHHVYIILKWQAVYSIKAECCMG